MFLFEEAEGRGKGGRGNRGGFWMGDLLLPASSDGNILKRKPPHGGGGSSNQYV